MSTRLEDWMPREAEVAVLAHLGRSRCGVFRIEEANTAGVTSNQVARLVLEGVVERSLPGTYRLAAIPASSEQRLQCDASLGEGDQARDRRPP